MRILKTVAFYYPFQEMGGPVVKVRELAVGLARRGHFVTVLTPNWGFQPGRAPEMRARRTASGWCAEEDGVESIFLPVWSSYRALAFCPGAVRFAREELGNYDVAHFYGLYDFLGPTVAFFCRRRNVPYLIEPMGMFKPIIRNVSLKNLYHTFARRRFFAGAHALIATSEQESAELRSSGTAQNRVLVRRNGVRGPAALPAKGQFQKRWNLPPNEKIVLFLGRIVQKKKPDLLINAFADYVHRNPENAAVHLVIAGPAEDRPFLAKLQTLSTSLGIAHRVLFTGPLFDTQKWEAYRDADVFVLPSQNENFGNSAAEAIVCGTPVIVSEHCGIAPIVRDKAGLVVALDRCALATALDEVLQNPERVREFQEAALLIARALSWDEPVSKMEEIYCAVRETAKN